ncbi:MAG: hypothetical protein WDO56_05980 [Gammaproteobacteria bacterium]
MQVLKPHSQKYPRAFGFLEDTLPTVRQKQPLVWASFVSHASLTDADAQAAVALNGTPPLLFAQDLGTFTWAQFDPEIPSRIEMSRDVLERFEKDPANAAAQTFLLSKALHEMCHWGCFRQQVPDPDTAGEEFEAEAFGAELRPWWLAAGAVPVPPARDAVDLRIFTDPAVRAALLVNQLTGAEHAPGRADDPAHKVFGGVDVAEGMARGFRNNNPGNIRIHDPWNGLAEPDQQTSFQRLETSFCVYKEPEWGLRAIAILMRKYKRVHQLSTPRQIIGRWAPTSDGNDVESYSGQLAKALGVGRDDVVDADKDDVCMTMMRAIATHENGSKPPYSDVQFETALRLL